jgi:hypothetical protein
VKTCGRRALLLLVLIAPGTEAGEFGFDVGRYERPRYEFSGYLQGSLEHLCLDRDSALYALSFPGEGPGSFERYRALAELLALYRLEQVVFNARVQGWAVDDTAGSRNDFTVQELYATTAASDRLSLEAGKRTLRWGTGYAWSPIAFLERPKDPTDPELSREGFIMAGGEYVRSFDGGRLRTLSFSPMIVPVSDSFNEDFGDTESVNLAARVYMLYRDTDLYLTARSDGSRPGALGIGLSSNLLAHLEIHGELAWLDGRTHTVIDDDGLGSARTRPIDLLLGVRYLTRAETTWILEYYRNGAGYSRQEMRRFFDLARGAGTDPAASPVARLARLEGYGAPQAMRDYLYVRVAKNDPWDVVYLNIGTTSIINLRDGSASFIPEVIYRGLSNAELRLRLALLSGGRNTEFGERLNDWRVEIRGRYFF